MYNVNHGICFHRGFFNMSNNKQYIVIDHLLQSIDLPALIENEAGAIFKWSIPGEHAVANCPMSWHKDTNASFHINKMINNVWMYFCFGCQAKGNAIHFAMDFLGKESKGEAIHYLCEKYNIKSSTDAQIESYKSIAKRVDNEKKLSNANIVASNQCRNLLRKNFDMHKKWVVEAYAKLNEAMDEKDMEKVERIGFEASKRSRL